MAGIAQRLRWLELAEAELLPKSADTGARLRLVERFERLAERQGVSLGGASSVASLVVQRALAEAPDGMEFWAAISAGVCRWLAFNPTVTAPKNAREERRSDLALK